MNIKNSSGLSVDFLDNGSVKSIDIAPIRIGTGVYTEFSRPGCMVWLRKKSDPYHFTGLIGPGSNSLFTFNGNKYVAKGSWEGIDFTCTIQLSNFSTSWMWSISLTNSSASTFEGDLYLVQETGLKPASSGLNNEQYISQYLERRILPDKTYGSVICCRQNMKEPTGNPWLMMACRNSASAASVDGMQFYGKTYRETGVPEGLLSDKLDGEYAGETTILVLQEKTFSIVPGEKHKSEFISTFLSDHPAATSEADLLKINTVISEFSSSADISDWVKPDKNLFNTAPFFPVDDLDHADLDNFFGKERRFSEESDGRLLSFYCGQNSHVVLKAKEVIVDRPHGHIIQSKAGFIPDENIMATTAFAYGVFNSHISQGNTNFNVLLSVCSSQFNLATETGQRIFVESDGKTYLLGVPSAFESGLNYCRWIYKQKDTCLQVRTWTSKKENRVNMDFRVLRGNDVKLIITHHFDSLDGWKINEGGSKGEFLFIPDAKSMLAGNFPEARFRAIVNTSEADFRACGDEVLYESGKSHGSSLFILEVKNTARFSLSFIGEICSRVTASPIADTDAAWNTDIIDGQDVLRRLCLGLTINDISADSSAISEILPWYGLNALTHFLTPYGLEQFSGAAWGTRDVSQGPLDLLLTMEKYEEVRKVLCIIFSNQNPDGGWPQWWMFDSYTDIRSDHSHGDIFYWVIIGLNNYIKITGDTGILKEVLPYYHGKDQSKPEKTALSEHLDRLIDMIVNSFIPGTALVPFGGGDWNDSLQPVSKELAERLISSWTVEMNYQAFTQFEDVCRMAGDSHKANEMAHLSSRIREDFNKYLIKDGVVAGYGLVEDDLDVSLLLHPSDKKTGIHYSILPMNRGIISGIFTKKQAEEHQELIEAHLKGPDGARLMDRPLKYKGGIQTIFQRAESSTFFGREIGLMYVHEHIRYAEAQALTGKPEAFVKALRQAIPVGYRDIVPCADHRQSNCYYSSSDVVFRNRYEADELYDQVKTGSLTLKGGWRVYSSGPGIYVSIIVTKLLGLRAESAKVILDPVIPGSMDGLKASIDFMGKNIELNYKVKHRGYSPETITVNGIKTEFYTEDNNYRKGGAVFSKDTFLSLLNKEKNTIEITV
jgi:1,2-beta-oligoglucan phosphorylase